MIFDKSDVVVRFKSLPVHGMHPGVQCYDIVITHLPTAIKLTIPWEQVTYMSRSQIKQRDKAIELMEAIVVFL